MLMSELFEEFKQYSQEKFTYRTNLTRFSIINKYLDPFLGHFEIYDLKSRDIRRLFEFVESTNLKNNTIFGIYVCLLSVFKFAKTMGYIDDSPMDESIKYGPTI